MTFDAQWSEYQRFRDGFEEILDPALHPMSWLDGEIWSGRLLLFSCADAAIIFEVRPYPSGALELHGMAATGKLTSIVSHLIPLAEEYGRGRGCVAASIQSRPGWGRLMKDYRFHQVTLRKGL